MTTFQLIHALCYTLVFSLIQGFILAIVAGLILSGTRKASATLRYNLLLLVLALFAVSCGITFINALAHAPAPVLKAMKPDGVAAATSSLSRLLAFLNEHSGKIVLVWMLIVCMRSLQLLAGLYGIHRLRHTVCREPDPHWQQYVKQLAEKMGITQAVRLVESGSVNVPMIIGYLKPLILMPAGLIMALPPAELEAILMHELAHIRRRDYLLNLLQEIMEILFFFNPAVWWISSLIKIEREHCCDDIVVATVGNSKDYIRALVSCGAYHPPAKGIAVALNGNKNHLLDRVKRLLSNNTSALTRPQKSLFVFCLGLLALFAVCFFHGRNNVVYRHRFVQYTMVSKMPRATMQNAGQNKMPLVTGVSQISRQIRSAPEQTKVQQGSATQERPDSEQAQAKQSETEEPVKELVVALLKEGLTQKNAANLSFALNNESFIVNKKLQPEKIFRKFKDIYEDLSGKKGNWAITYHSIISL